jgi:hypothetical protein
MLKHYRRLRVQFSLSTLILLFTIAALLVGLWTTSREVREARVELKKYRRDVGYLDLSDPNKVCARALRTAGNLRWEWRIYLPEKRRFRLCFLSKDIPEKGIPDRGPGARTSLPSGEFLLKAVAEKNLISGWAFSVSSPGTAASFGIAEEEGRWIGRAPTWSSGVGEETLSADPGAPLELLRLRVPKSTTTKQGTLQTTDHSSSPQPSEGLLVWIEEF